MRHRYQFIARVGEPRQHRKLRLVDVLDVRGGAKFQRGAARDHVRPGIRGHCLSELLSCQRLLAFGFGCFLLIEVRIAEPDQGFAIG
jgi:hypothetical protein